MLRHLFLFFIASALTNAVVGQERLLTSLGHAGSVQSVAITPDGRLGLTGGADGTARLWDLSSGAELQTFVGHDAPINSVALSIDGRLAATASQDNTGRVWDTTIGLELTSRLPINYGECWIFSIVFSPDQKSLMATGSVYLARIWNFLEGRASHDIPFSPADAAVRHARSASPVYRPDGKSAIFGFENGSLSVVAVDSGVESASFHVSSNAILSIAISEDGEIVATADSRGVISVCHFAAKQAVCSPESGLSPAIGVAFGHDARTLVATGEKRVELWNLHEHKLRKTITGFSATLTSTATSRDRQFALTGTSDGKAYLWNTETGEFVRVLGGKSRSIISVAAPEYNKFGLLDDSGRVWVWNAAREAAPIQQTGLDQAIQHAQTPALFDFHKTLEQVALGHR